MGMNADTKNLLFIILAVVGGFVVLGWVLKIAFKLIGLFIVLAIAVGGYLVIKKLVEQGR
ncbi:hypothetical protein TS85_08855 [Sphingomonas hengshuiensis]|uniref:Uncharacterized protein n=2 Tax=Sphingomonas hengshuiensis TaxID=1609977 RepID=A0A7U4J7V9_9SPHN|nr:hypothetical protein TS85_08855 [Sphingomonas hengshuiensis]